jgi:hypothetical protein
MKHTIEQIEELLDAYVYAHDEYITSQTCSSETYKAQREASYQARNALLSAIESAMSANLKDLHD